MTLSVVADNTYNNMHVKVTFALMFVYETVWESWGGGSTLAYDRNNKTIP